MVEKSLEGFPTERSQIGRRSLVTGGLLTAMVSPKLSYKLRPRKPRLLVIDRQVVAPPAAAPPGQIVIDAEMLRSYGAKLDGVADDLPAVQQSLAEARRRTPATIAVPAVLFELPAGVMALSGPPQSGRFHVTIRGAGQNVSTLLMKTGGTGLWHHGTESEPAAGYFQVQDLSFVDENSKGSGCVGLAIRFTAGAPQSAMTWQGVALRKWTRPAVITNCPRNWHCENVTVFGPDFAMQEAAGFEIASTADFAPGCFTYVFINVLVANYAWGWRYDIQAPLEGQRFYSCTCYNGWGMVQAHCHGGTAPGQVGGSYKSLLWYFTDCDWQGLGYGLDLVNIRDVVIDKGFFIATANNDGRPTPAVPGTTVPRQRRRYLSFSGCSNVTLRDVEFDVLAAGIEDSLALVFVDADCESFRALSTQIHCYSRIYAGFEFASAERPNRRPNTMGEFDTNWRAWPDKMPTETKVRDPEGNQIDQSALRDSGVGDVTTQGRVTLETETAPLKQDNDRRITVLFPTRYNGKSYFQAGAPIITFSVAAKTGVPSAVLVEKSTKGFVVVGTGLRDGATVQIAYRATGT